MKKILYILFVFLITSCSSKLVEPLNTNPLSINPSGHPVQNMTNFTKSVSCLDNMIADSGKGDVLITIDSLPNESSDKMADSAKTMLHSAFSNMGTKNQKIKVIDYQSAKSGTLELLMDAKRGTAHAAKKDFVYPEFFIQGSISQSENKFAKKGTGVGAEAGQIASLDIASDDSASAIALDMQAGYIDNLQLIPGVFSNNILTIVENEEEIGGGVAFMEKASIDFSMDYQRKDGKSAAIRSLIELGAVELIGKLLHLPYEGCLTEEGRLKVANTSLNTQFKTGISPNAVTADKTQQEAILTKKPDNKIDFNMDMGSKRVNNYVDYQVSVTLKAPGYLRCFYKDEDNVISTIYPNPNRPNIKLMSNKKMMVPDYMDSFDLRQDGNGRNEIMCLTSSEDIFERLPSYLKGEALTPISGANNFDKIESDIKSEGLAITVQSTFGELRK